MHWKTQTVPLQITESGKKQDARLHETLRNESEVSKRRLGMELMSCSTFNSKPWKQKWISETSRDWDRRIEGFCEHIANDGSLEGVSGQDLACGWAEVQFYYEKKDEPWYAICGTMLAELQVQRSISRAELWAFTMALAGMIIQPSMLTARASFDGLWRAGRRIYWADAERCGLMETNWELLTECAEKNWDTTKKHQFVVEGNEKANELVNEQMWMEGAGGGQSPGPLNN